MAVTHLEATRNGIANYVVDQLDGGTLEFMTSADAEVATLTFGTPAFGAASEGAAAANAITSDSSATGGTVAKARLITSGASGIVFCSVTASGGGGDIIMSSLTVGATDTVSCSSLTYTAPL